MRRLSVSPRFFSLRTSVLNGWVSRPMAAARSGARTAGRSAMSASVSRVHGPWLLGLVEPVEAPGQLCQSGFVQLSIRGKHGARVRPGDVRELDAQNGILGSPAKTST